MISRNLYITGKKENYKFDTKLSFNEKIVIEKYNETNFEYGHKNIIGIKKRAGHKKYKAKESSVASNVLNGDLKVSRPLEKLVTDITYLPWGEKNMYLSSIMDLHNGEIIAHTIGDTQDLAFVIDTLDQLPKLIESCILHLDQGLGYTSGKYQTSVNKKSITMSMSRKGTPSDNAPIESFHSTLKSETFYKYKNLKVLMKL